MRQYFIHNGQNQEGPFDLEHLKKRTLKKETPIWYEGIEKWTTVGEIEELKNLISSPLPPPLFPNKETSKNFHDTSYSPSPTYTPSTSTSSPSYDELFPTKKKSALLPFLITGGVLVIGIISWLAYQNSQNSSTIDSLQEKVSTQETVYQTQQSQIAEKEAERQRVNTANTLKNMNYRNNWDKYIKVTNSEPTIDFTFGGISEFNVYVSNEMEYTIDQVDVLVQYIRKNGEIWQSSVVHLQNVSPNSIESGIAPKSINGIKVICSIEKVISDKLNFCFPTNSGVQEDPFFCK